MNNKEIEQWVQNKLDYWEIVCDYKSNNSYTSSEVVAFEERMELGEIRGRIDAFYQVREFLDGLTE